MKDIAIDPFEIQSLLSEISHNSVRSLISPEHASLYPEIDPRLWTFKKTLFHMSM